MVNDEYIHLNRNSKIYIAPMMNIRVADNDTLRYYLYNEQYVVPAPGAPSISIPDNITSNTPMNISMFEQAAEITRVNVEIVDPSNRTVFSRDITNLGRGSGEFWLFEWTWNATALRLSDDNSQVMDMGDNLVPALLRLNQSSPEEQVGVYFNSTGRIGRILDSNSIYYVSRSEYQKLKVTSDYDTMIANDTLRRQFIKIEPGVSTLRFQDIVNGRLNPSNQNHTLQGTIASLEPRAREAGADPGRYELRARIENAVNAMQVTGEYFNVTPAPMRDIYLGSAEALPGETVSIPVEVPSSGMERAIDLRYNSTIAQALAISGNCSPTWQLDGAQLERSEGRIKIRFPANCSKAELSFRAVGSNSSVDINATGWSGFEPEDITNGTITILPLRSIADETKKGNAPGYAVSLITVSLALVLHLRRRG
jgi:hypothetical protein